jgi:tetratricopeptide (TPR) repeat protein
MYSDLTRIADASFAQWVNTAFKQCHSTLMLSRSPLAASPLVTPALVLDELSPTADERGHALRLVLQWAVGELAPAPAAFPFAVERPFDDPTWRDPRWWRYTLLRHRYLEPLHPDAFVEGGRFIETLLALTGIPSEDALFDERNRAIREVAQRLQRQLKDGAAAGELERMALADLTRPLAQRPASLALLGIASIFDEVFPRAALLELAGREAVGQDLAALDWLVDQRYLRASDDGAELWLSPRLREHMYRRQSRSALLLRHERAHRRFLQTSEILAAAHHGLRAERWEAVAVLALTEAPGLLADLQAAPLREIIDQLPVAHLSAAQQYAIQLLRADLAAQAGEAEVAIAACRTALRTAPGAPEQARIYRRMGKLHEGRNQLAALGYYQQAVERFPTAPANDPELIELLKDRGWLHILRKEWAAAEADLQRGLALAATSPATVRANLLDALAHWAMQQHAMTPAIGYAQNALALREEAGDLLGVAKSSGNLGLLYSAIGDYPGAVAAYHEAMGTCRRLGNRELVATALLNLGLAYHLQNLLDDAVAVYQECLGEARAVELHVIEVKALSNLAEALADLARLEEARRCWSAGLAAL